MMWFQSRSVSERRSAVKNVIAVMMADGKISDEEKAFLAMVCKRVGVSPSELEEMLGQLTDIRFVKPKDANECAAQLFDAVLMMMADGDISSREMTLCRAIALGLGFRPAAVDRVIELVVDAARRHQTSGGASVPDVNLREFFDF